MKRLVGLLLCGAIGGCATPVSPDGAYVNMLRDTMVEAARLADPSENPEQAVRAARAWRSVQED